MDNNNKNLSPASEDNGNSNLQSLKKVPFSVSEAYKTIRTNLISALKKQNSNIAVISSPNASEGKSTTSINIAISLSQINKKVLLVDSDVHRPSIHNKLKVKNEDGLMNVINGISSLSEAVKHYNSKLDILTTGPIPQNATEIFSHPDFDKLLEEIKEEYDYIIFDTPPVNLLSDSLVIAEKIGNIVLVIRSGVTTHETLRRAVASAKQLDINVIGVILNGSDYSKNKYQKKYYGSY